jgi:arsenate reductase
MAERGIDISEYKVKNFTQVPKPIHFIVVVCGQAAEECPTIPGAEFEYWDLEDPIHEGIELSDIDELALFRKVRDEIEANVRDFLVRHDGRATAGFIETEKP